MDLLNCEKLEESFGNGYYDGKSQMMNWFAKPTAIENVNGEIYQSTPYGVPTDEFWWEKQNKLNRDRIKRNLKNTVNVFPYALPSGDRLEDYFNADAESNNKILGMPKKVAYASLAIVLVIGGYLAYKKLK